MTTLREDLDAALSGASKPAPYVLTTLGGVTVYIRIMSARQVAQWWSWVFEISGQRKTYDLQLVELWCRLCVDAEDKQLYPDAADAKGLRERTGGGKAMAEFFTEAKRRNFLYETTVEEDLERNRFFGQQVVAGATALKTETPLTDSSSNSQPNEENLTPTS